MDYNPIRRIFSRKHSTLEPDRILERSPRAAYPRLNGKFPSVEASFIVPATVKSLLPTQALHRTAVAHLLDLLVHTLQFKNSMRMVNFRLRNVLLGIG